MTELEICREKLRLFTLLDENKLRAGDEQEYINLRIRISNAKYLLGTSEGETT